jgi:hypothetical protein
MFIRSAAFMMSVAISATALAGPKDHAYRIYNRLTGTPPNPQILEQMTQLVSQGKAKEAAKLAMDQEQFYSIFLKNLVSPWVNKESKRDFVLNDFTATLIGMIRDDADFSTVLTHDDVYVSATYNAQFPYSMVADNPATATMPGPIQGTTVPAVEGNQQYIMLDAAGLSYKTDLQKMSQNALHPTIPSAGVQTTRGFAEQFFFAGTNRAPLVEITKTFLCRDIDTLSDNTRPDTYIRRDVPRSPGGEPLAFLSKCSGCHAGMDPLTKAYAYYDWHDVTDPAGSFRGLTYVPEAQQSAATVRPKMVRNDDVYPQGYVPADERWINLWVEGQNGDPESAQNVGWRGAVSGKGIKELGAMLVNTEAFDMCMPQRIYKAVCLVSADTQNDKLFIKKLSSEWKESKYNMKELISSVAAECLGRDAAN